MLSTAVIGPSGVSKRTAISFATRMASLDPALDAITHLLALSGHQGCHGGGVSGLDPHVDDRDTTRLNRCNRLLERSLEVCGRSHRSETLRTLRPRHPRKIDVGVGNALADPAVLYRPIAHAGHTLLVQLIVEEGTIVGDDDQQRDAVMRRGPKCRNAHQEVTVAANRDR